VIRVVERIGPLVPALATVGASVCVSSLLLTTVPHALGPPPGVPPLKNEARPASVSLSPLTQPVSHSRVARSADHGSPARPARAPTTLTPSSRRVPTPVSQGASRPPPPAPPSPPSPPTPPAAPSVTPPAAVTVTAASTGKPKRPKDTTRPGWGHGDPNHDHTGPPGKPAKDQKDQTTPPQAAPPATPGTEHGSPQGVEKKSERR
jgi:hypothetical protein